MIQGRLTAGNTVAPKAPLLTTLFYGVRMDFQYLTGGWQLYVKVQPFLNCCVTVTKREIIFRTLTEECEYIYSRYSLIHKMIIFNIWSVLESKLIIIILQTSVKNILSTLNNILIKLFIIIASTAYVTCTTSPLNTRHLHSPVTCDACVTCTAYRDLMCSISLAFWPTSM